MTKAFVAIWLSVQIVVPAILMVVTYEGIAPFGWQMFAKTRPLPEFWLEGADSSRVKFDFVARVPQARRELDYRAFLPERLCTQEANVAAVVLVNADSTETRIPCR